MASTGPHAIAERLTVPRSSGEVDERDKGVETDDRVAILQRGAFAHADGDLDIAAQSYEAVLRDDADSTTALNNLGLLRLQQGDIDAAAKLLDRLQTHADLSSIALTNIANLRVMQGRVSEAIDLLEQAVVSDPNSEAWVTLGKIKMLIADFAGAEIALREAAERLAPRGEVFEHLATCMLQRGQLELGLAAATASVELSPGSDSAWRQLSVARMQASDLGLGVRAAECAVESNPYQPENYRQLGLALVAVGRAADAAAVLDQGLSVVPDPLLAEDRAVLSLADGEADRTLELLDAHGCLGARADYYRAMALLVQEKTKEALKLLTSVAAADAPEAEKAAALLIQVEPKKPRKRASAATAKSKSTSKRKAK